MPGLSAKFDPDAKMPDDPLDIRTRVLISIIVCTCGLYLTTTGPLLLLSAATGYYVAKGGKFKVILVTYLFVALMCALSVGVIFGTVGLVKVVANLIDKPHIGEIFAGFFRDENYHTPFLRMIPSVNVMLAIGMNFQVQRFVGAMKSIRLPRVIFLPLMVFCRFIPEFVSTIRQLHDAVLMRGFSMSFGSVFVHPIQTLRLTIIPLAVRTLRIADNLSMVAEMKRIGYAKRPTQFRTLSFTRLDLYAVLALTFFSLASVAWEQIIATPTEARLEQLWAHDDYRPSKKLHISGESTHIKVIRPGTVNPDKTGPDFINAEIEIEGKTYRGDIELHVFPGKWDDLNHSSDPKFANVILYATWFGWPEADTLPETARFTYLRRSVRSDFHFAMLSKPAKKRGHGHGHPGARPKPQKPGMPTVGDIKNAFGSKSESAKAAEAPAKEARK